LFLVDGEPLVAKIPPLAAPFVASGA